MEQSKEHVLGVKKALTKILALSDWFFWQVSSFLQVWVDVTFFIGL